MATSYLGQLLSSLGTQIPATIRQRQEDALKRQQEEADREALERRAKMDDLQYNLAMQEYDKAERQKQRESEKNAALDKFTSDYEKSLNVPAPILQGGIKALNPIPSPLPKEYGPELPPQEPSRPMRMVRHPAPSHPSQNMPSIQPNLKQPQPVSAAPTAPTAQEENKEFLFSPYSDARKRQEATSEYAQEVESARDIYNNPLEKFNTTMAKYLDMSDVKALQDAIKSTGSEFDQDLLLKGTNLAIMTRLFDKNPAAKEEFRKHIEESKNSNLMQPDFWKSLMTSFEISPARTYDYFMKWNELPSNERAKVVSVGDLKNYYEGKKQEILGKVEAQKPLTSTDENKKWTDTYVKPYGEMLQNYNFAKTNPYGIEGRIALIKGLEKTREPNSAVMYGDAEIWRKAQGILGNVFTSTNPGEVTDAMFAAAAKRITDKQVGELLQLLEQAKASGDMRIHNAQYDKFDMAKNDLGWDEARAQRVYPIPSSEDKTNPYRKKQQKTTTQTEPVINSGAPLPPPNDKNKKDPLGLGL